MTHPDFTEAEYARLLELAAARWRFVGYADRNLAEPHVIWRHDIDYSPHRALAMARQEAARGLRCVYHILPSGRYYNPIEPEIAEIFAKIAGLGHEIGLHFDMDVFGPETPPSHDDVLAAIAFQKGIVEQAAGTAAKSMSFHNFTLNLGRLIESEAFCGMTNASAKSIVEGYSYVSDSNGIWRHRKLDEVLSGETLPRLHVLTHPVWWTPEAMTPYKRFRRAVDGRTRSALDFYIQVMRRDGRFDTIGALLGVPGALPPPETIGDPQDRFAFGRNWQEFLQDLDADSIQEAQTALAQLLGKTSLKDTTFLDIGCGSGLSCLAALNLDATVRGFDFDNDSVQAATSLLTAQAPGKDWGIERGSVLDLPFMAGLGLFDIVYSWGVLHHTGALWNAVDSASRAVKPGGLLALALYNDQGGASRRWRTIKRLYVASPRAIRFAMVLAIGAFFKSRGALIRLLRLQNPFSSDEKRGRRTRGMSPWHDLVDWVGGYPFEVAKPDDLVDFLAARGFQLKRLKTVGNGHGCNEYLFRREE